MGQQDGDFSLKSNTVSSHFAIFAIVIPQHPSRPHGAIQPRSRATPVGSSSVPGSRGAQPCCIDVLTVRLPVSSSTTKRSYRHICQSACPWNIRFAHELADDSPFAQREFIAGKDAVTLATDILALNQDAFSAAFRKSPMKRAKLAGLRRNAAVVLENLQRPREV